MMSKSRFVREKIKFLANKNLVTGIKVMDEELLRKAGIKVMDEIQGKIEDNLIIYLSLW